MSIKRRKEASMIVEGKECQHLYGSDRCKRLLDSINEGTLNKINFMNEYVRGWYNKIFSFKPSWMEPYEGVMFIDCMSNSGAYVFEGNLTEGTSQKVQHAFSSQNGERYTNKEFIIAVNDLSKGKIECQKCIWDEQIEKRDNTECRFYNKDVNEFLSTEALELLKESERKHYHVLLFYDPYDVLINWDNLSPFLKSKTVDVVLTHFWSNDSIRAIGQVKKDEVKRKYEEAYGLPYCQLEEEMKRKTPYEKNLFLRERLVNQIENRSIGKKFIGYAPIFNSRNVVIYDIVSISTSNASRILLKDTLYKQYKPQEVVQQLDLFADTHPVENDYISSRSAGISERDYFYSPNNYAKIIYNEFKGMRISKGKFDKFIASHNFIPTNAKTDIKRILESQYGVKIHKDKAAIKEYVF